MAAHDQNDARGSARVLALTAKKCLDETYEPSKHRSTLNSLYRLLEAYRSHGFLGFEYEPRAPRGPEALTLLPRAERNVADLRLAFDRAFEEVYRERERGEAVQLVENVLKSIVYPGKVSVKRLDRERASAFLKNFVDNLYPVR